MELAIIIPTFNERDNIAAISEDIEDALPDVSWEVVFVVDDSSDGTGSVLHSVCRNDLRVRALRRIGRRGLASAVVEGVLSTSTPYVAVMDADMQHDERLLIPMLLALRKDQADLIIGSRYKERGGLGDLDDRRRKISEFATCLSRVIPRMAESRRKRDWSRSFRSFDRTCASALPTGRLSARPPHRRRRSTSLRLHSPS